MSASKRVRPWIYVAAIWLWPALFNVITRLVGAKTFGWGAPSARELLFTFGDWFGYAFFTPVIFRIAERWPVVRPHIARRFAIQLGFALVFCVAWAVGGKLLDLLIVLAVQPSLVQKAISDAGGNLTASLARNVFSWIMTTIPFGVVVYTTVAGLAHAITYFSEARDREVQLARLAEQLTGARFAALQAQLNPHFMFNTLNTIAVLVRDGDRAGAVRIVEQLSEVLRRTLSRHRANEVALSEELDLVRQYSAIEQARFSDRLRVDFVVPADLGLAAIPSFAVQHLVENAIRHGIAKRAEASLVRISVRRDGEILDLTVADDGPGPGASTAAPGHGRENTRERLRVLYGDRGSLVVAAAAGGTGAVATLRVPFRSIEAEEPHA
ncbi:MAG TPA: histidine kinase [Gemmatimonadaceae bacterium]